MNAHHSEIVTYGLSTSWLRRRPNSWRTTAFTQVRSRVKSTSSPASSRTWQRPIKPKANAAASTAVQRPALLVTWVPK